MNRQDYEFPFLLKYENVAWYDGQAVHILDRRIYPGRIEYVTCKSYQEVTAAIKAMVTQSGGPFMAAGMGMALAARQIEAGGTTEQNFTAQIRQAAYELSHARPTTSAKMSAITQGCAEAGIKAKAEGLPADRAVFDYTLELTNERYARSAAQACYVAEKIDDGALIMTQCFAEYDVGSILRECRAQGKIIKVLCPETRPFFQGARLTASVVHDMGFEVTVITDNMPAWAMKTKGVSLFTSAADVICMDGHIVNKVGTYQIALAASHLHIPYYCTGNPDPGHPTVDSVIIEEREGDEVLKAMGVRTAMTGVRGWYPAFDITPPELCTGIATDKGLFAPEDLAKHFS